MLPKFTRRIAIALISLCLLPQISLAADDSAKLKGIVDTVIRPLMAEYDVPGMAVAVTVDGQAFIFNYGVASREKNTPVSEATLFEIGSLSKTFTATLAAYAQVQDKLSFDDHPGKYIPQLKGSPIDKASLANLATYTAGGLPLQFPDEVSNDRITDYFQHWKPDAEPGTQRQYSNPSIGLFGYITGLALKSDFADAMESQLFPQLGLNHSYIHVPENAMINYAWGYDKTNKAIRVNPGPFDAEAYGVKTTAADMIRFVQLNIEPNKLTGPMRRAVDGTHVGYFKCGDMVQGFGWEHYAYPVTLDRLLAGNSSDMLFKSNAVKQLTPPQAPSVRILFNKTGSTGGFGSYAVFIPAQKIGIVMLANKSYPIPARVKAAYAILEQLMSTAK